MKKIFFALLIPLSVMAQETQDYKVIKSLKEVEIRYYPSAMLARVDASTGNNSNFSKLFNYITGSNETSDKIAMTSPVYMFNKDKSGMAFVLPKNYNKENTPQPKNPSIKVYASEPGYYAAIQYSGYTNQEKEKVHTSTLFETLSQNKWTTIGKVMVLGYDSPYKFYNRRNEVMIEVKYEGTN